MFATLVIVSVRETVVGLPDFFVLDHLLPASCVRWEHIPPSRLDVLVLDVCSSEVFVRRRLFQSFLGVLTPSNLERARVNVGSYCFKGAPPIGEVSIIVR